MDSVSQINLPPTEKLITKIVILSISALGELLLTIPLILEVQRVYPLAKISLVCTRKAVAAFADELQVVDSVVLLPAKARRSPVDLLKSIRLIKELDADIVFQPFSSHGTFGNILVGASQADIRCGFPSGRFHNALTHCIPIDPINHRISSNLNLLRRLGHIDIGEPYERYLPAIEKHSKLYPGGDARNQLGNFAILSIGSDPQLAFKKWPTANWTELCRMLAHVGITPVFVGDGSIVDEANAVIASSGGHGVNLGGKTQFADLAALIQSARVVIGTDGMILHFASAMHKACVGIFGPTAPSVVGPWGDIHVNVYLSLPCSPCYGAFTIGKGAGCATRECLTRINVAKVYRHALAIIREEPTVCSST